MYSRSRISKMCLIKGNKQKKKGGIKSKYRVPGLGSRVNGGLVYKDEEDGMLKYFIFLIKGKEKITLSLVNFEIIDVSDMRRAVRHVSKVCREF